MRSTTSPRQLPAAAFACHLAISMWQAAPAADFHWDTNGSAAGLGSASSPANWSGSFWNTDATGGAGGSVGTWTNGTSSQAYLGGNPGTLSIDSGLSSGVTTGSLSVGTSGYKITTSAGTRNLTVQGAVTLSPGIEFTLEKTGTGGSTFNIGSLAGTSDSDLVLSSGVSSSNLFRIDVTGSTSAISTPITIQGTAGGGIGLVAAGGSGATVTLTGGIQNSSLSPTLLGATFATGVLKVENNGISGDGGLLVGANGSGSGTVRLSTASAFTGGTTLKMNASGKLIAEHSDALGTGSLSIQSGQFSTTVGNLALSSGGLELSDGSINLNASSVGILTLGANENFSMTGGTWLLDLANSTDRILGSGSGVFSITGGIFDLGGGDIDYEITYDLLSGFDSGSVADLVFANYDAGYLPSLSSSGILMFSEIPEPGSAFAGLLLASGLLRRRRPLVRVRR